MDKYFMALDVLNMIREAREQRAELESPRKREVLKAGAMRDFQLGARFAFAVYAVPEINARNVALWAA